MRNRQKVLKSIKKNEKGLKVRKNIPNFKRV